MKGWHWLLLGAALCALLFFGRDLWPQKDAAYWASRARRAKRRKAKMRALANEERESKSGEFRDVA